MTRSLSSKLFSVAIVLAAGAFAPFQALADTATQASVLPNPRSASSAVFDGHAAYVFGGDICTLNCSGSLSPTVSRTAQIVKHDPVGNTATILPAALPAARAFTSAIFDGQNAYIFGGVGPTTTSTTRTNQIVRLNLQPGPQFETVTTMTAVLPKALQGTSAVWDGEYAYIFGGSELVGTTVVRSANIYRYDPSSDSITTLGVTLPVPIQDTSAVWDGTKAYIFGGDIITTGTTAGRTNKIVAFDPVANTVTTLSTVLPTSSRDRTGAAWVAAVNAAYVVGGRGGASDVNGNSTSTTALSSVIKFDPVASSTAVTDAALPQASENVLGGFVIARSGSSVVSDATHGDHNDVYVFGGVGSLLRTAQIVRYTVALGPPPPPAHGTSLDFTANTQTAGYWGTNINVEALLTDTTAALPLEGKTVRFTLGTQTRNVVTDASGLAATTITLPSVPGTSTLNATFTAEPGFNGSTKNQAGIVATKRLALLSYDGPTTGDEKSAILEATVRDSVTNSGLGNYAVTFALGSFSGTATTATGTGHAAKSFTDVPRGNYTASATIGGTTLYDPSPSSASVGYLVDWGYVFIDEGGMGQVSMSLLTSQYEFAGQGDSIGPTGDGLQIASTGIGGIASPPPVDTIAVVQRLEGDIMVGAFDLQNLQFLAVVTMANGNNYQLRRSCLGDMTTCPQLPTCIFNQPPLSDRVVLHQGPFCP